MSPRPSFPPGWKSAYSSLSNGRFASTVIASASPTARSTAVEAVGASPIGQASATSPMATTRSAARASGFARSRVTATTRAPIFFSAGSRRRISSVSPEFESAMTTSSFVIRPRSPWAASAGWT